MERIALLMAGGNGTRLWPLSSSKKPKQTLKIFTDKELIRVWIDICQGMSPSHHVYISTNEEQAGLIHHLVKDNINTDRILTEPCIRNTGPGVLLSALRLREKYGDATVGVFSTDILIKDVQTFQKRLLSAYRYSEEYRKIVVFGIYPTYPSTGYGYIKKGRPDEANPLFFEADGFTEKPDLLTATELLNDDRYRWNSGMFIFRLSVILQEFERYQPKLFRELDRFVKSEPFDNRFPSLDEVYRSLENISLDKAIMEKSEIISVMEGDFGWTDLGTWNSMDSMLPKDETGNLVYKDHLVLESSRCIVYGTQKPVIVVGIDNTVIVDTDDCLLVCSKERVQDMKWLMDKIKTRGLDELL